MIREKFCKYCGRELEITGCICDDYRTHSGKKPTGAPIICDTCRKQNDSDANYCVHCGMPLFVNGKIKSLQKELRGDNAKDVIDVYADEMKRKNKNLFPLSFVVTISIATLFVGVIFGSMVLPMIRNAIVTHSFRRNAELENNLEPEIDDANNESANETNPRNAWIIQGDDTYAYDADGNQVIDNWVIKVDKNGIEQEFYFDKNGKLVKDTWVDNDHYVGSDGAMLKEQMTPDGFYVDEDGVFVPSGDKTVEVEEDTNTYYNAPDTSSGEAVQQRSALSVNILGVKAGEEYPLYIENATKVTDAVSRGADTCEILYYVPTIEGADADEVGKINYLYQSAFYDDFINQVKAYALSLEVLPKSIQFTTLEQRNAKSNNFRVILSGKIYPQEGGLVDNIKYTFIYNRKNVTIKVQNSTS